MVDRIGKGGALAREAILAAMKSQAQKADEVRQAAANLGQDLATRGAQESSASGFAKKLSEGIEAIDSGVRSIDDLPKDLVSGEIDDFHEVAVQIKKAEFGFRFAMEIRNKLIDAYREVMRMHV
jgi:flagellar hook-basal body complex protein FliE